jgi:hypothetical protein
MSYYFDPNMDPELQELMNEHAIGVAKQAIAEDEERIRKCEVEIAEIEDGLKDMPQPDPMLVSCIVCLREDIAFYRGQIAKQENNIKILSLRRIPHNEPADC